MSVPEQFEKSALLIGEDALTRLLSSRIAVFGVGGVGGYICEALARAGIGQIDIFDRDTVSVTNINRQIIALSSTVGRAKVDVMRERILDINPSCRVNAYRVFYLPENADSFDLTQYDYIADAVDTVSAKVEIITRAKSAGVPVISAMGAGNKTDPTRFEVTDIYKTSVCPLARIMRKLLKERGVEALKVVYSREEPIKSCAGSDPDTHKVSPGSLAFVPSVAGLIMAGEIINDICRSR